ncbi:MAG: Ku protein [Actinomycetota bacterium]|nr:Ku protein [Actinomycetota bacterium]
MPRSMWSGAISFGLVTVPVKLYSAVQQKDISFHQIDQRSGSRIRYKRVSEKTGREVPYEQIAKGYEVDKGTYVVIDPKELEEVDPERTHTIDIQDFVDMTEIDPIYFEHSYWLAPGTGGDTAYELLRRAMEAEGKIGMGRVVIRTKEYLAAIRPYEKGLALHTMLYPDEIVPPKELPHPKNARVGERELKMAKQLIDSLSSEFEPDKYHDTYRKRVLDLVKKKAKGETITVEETTETPKVIDLLEALKASVEETGSAGGRRKRKTTKRKSA